jgi:hypothetical protein
MFEFLGRGKAKSDKSAADAGPSTLAQTVSLSATQREMVRMTLHGVLKLNGMPGNWIVCEVMPVRIPGQGDALLVQLEVMHWHDALVLHAPAFEKDLLEALNRFEPHAEHTRYLFAWKFSPACGCPHTSMPDPGFWSTPASPRLGPVATHPARIAPVRAPAPTTAPTPAPAPAKAAAKRAPPPVDDDDDDDNGFAATQLNDFR